MKKRIFQYIAGFTAFLIAIGYILPEKLVIPVMGAKTRDWNHQTFWYEPWGKSGVHKGIDIFAKKNTPSLSATDGVVIYYGKFGIGGNVIVVLGPKWKIHYYAHLASTNVSIGKFVRASQTIGAVGDSGNAKGKSPHLHYSVVTLLPYFWRWDKSTQGWKKMFYLNPSERLLSIYSKG
ncbi:MAG: M23 family peptidase [Candidatus Parabeggiatoa sp. nov. 3]|nr:MAG: M23 family peptidase [Gammaproteobacteria bacterium]RKZ64340.1 MAG: M23 family peptidase [Gammaproteobacteria bacterium]RKZ80782.1 MAG: M23 family peptidase [Gammaproteobacteria bacterium]